MDGYAVRYRYQDNLGKIHERTEELMEDEYKGWKPGKEVSSIGV